uniref:PB1-like domain-containing protein n=1 Tax=Chenopodium quinoa TaxID=63459 RepID=A0A803MPI8_CHEQI
MEDIPMSVIVHYGGSWEETPTLVYVGGTTKIFDELPADLYAIYFKKMIDSLGYEDISKLHYCDPLKRVDVGVRFLSYDDATFVEFLSLLYIYRVMDVFVEHEEDSEDELNGRGTFTSLLGRANPVVGSTNQTTEPRKPITVVDEIDYFDEGIDNEDVEVVNARE